ncbi:TraR/DksA C4-type zinc finger protein [Polaromonas sp. P1(28)-13]|nr:TraR/DksA C4-type zinc finger protein [Polaromonas sp. P1(28)-13]
MDKYDSSMAEHFRQVLAERADHLRQTLQGDSAITASPEPREVQDFKDVADQEELATVGDVQAAQARVELKQVLAAQRRLEAMPATPFCTSCQSAHEHSHGHRP